MGTGRAPRPRRLRSLGGQVIHKMRGLRTCVRVPCTVVPEAGFEPACPFGQWLLRPSRKPVPPLGLETTQRSVAEMRTRQEVDRVMALRAQDRTCPRSPATRASRGARSRAGFPDTLLTSTG